MDQHNMGIASGSMSMARAIDPGGELEQMGDGAPFLLTPEALMTYCQKQLRSIDGAVRETFDTQKSDQAELEALSILNDDLADKADGVDDGAFIDKLERDLIDVADRIREKNPSLAAKLDSFRKDVLRKGPNGQPDDKLAAAEVKGLQETVTDGKDAISKRADLNMVQLQSLMSQRQSALQICTNLVQALGDTTKQIAGNVGK
jgi:hypothetical protein